MRTVEVGRGGTRALCYAPGGALYAATGAGRVLSIDGGGEARELFRVPTAQAPLVAMYARPDGDLLHAVIDPFQVAFRVWDARRGRLVYPADRSIDPAGQFGAAGTESNLIQLLDLAGFHTPREREFAQLTRDPVRLDGSSDCSRLAVATARGVVVVWDAVHSRLQSQIKLAGRAVPQALAVSQSGVVALALADEIRFYDADTGTLTGSSLTAKAVTLLALAPVGEVCLSGDGGAGVTLWRGGKPAGRFDFGVGKVRAAAVAPDGLTAAIGGTSRAVAVVDLEG